MRNERFIIFEVQTMKNNFFIQNSNNAVGLNGAENLILEMYERIFERVIMLMKNWRSEVLVNSN
jgi:hypothetical protein